MQPETYWVTFTLKSGAQICLRLISEHTLAPVLARFSNTAVYPAVTYGKNSEAL